MKRLLSSLFLLTLFLPAPLLAQEVSEVPGPVLESVDPSGNVSCFDYYRFGSVQSNLETDLAETVPGANINFKGKIKNDNDYPVVNGTLFVKIFLRDENTFKEGDGNQVVDQFQVEGTWNLPAKGEKEVAFSWHVPENARGGEYYLATFFNTEGRYNLSGLSFTDDVIGNSVQFKVNSQEKGVYLDKTKTTLNGQDHHFAAYPLHFKKDEKVDIKAVVVNPTAQSQVVQLTWEEYTWDAMRKENLKNKKYELVEIGANESKDLSYTVSPKNTSVSYVIATTKDQYGKSIQGIRFVRDGVEETRINFPSLTKFPIKKGEQNSLFACAHSTNLPKVPGNILTLTLRDDKQNIIHEYKYEGDITGPMGGFKDDFTPEKSYDKVFLTATLQRNNEVVEEVTIPYDCSVIDKDMCSPIGSLFGDGAKSIKSIAIILLSFLSLIAILAILIHKMKEQKRNNRFK